MTVAAQDYLTDIGLRTRNASGVDRSHALVVVDYVAWGHTYSDPSCVNETGCDVSWSGEEESHL